jgi:quercetin dioxygenase-like cupin family protein
LKIASIVISGIIALIIPPAALALEAGAQVQASTVLKAQSSWDGKPVEYPSGKAEITGLVVELVPGAQTGWHFHPVPSFAYILEGELEIERQNGGVNRVKAGEAVAEVVDTWHNGRNVGTGPARLVVFYAGVVGGKLTVEEKERQVKRRALSGARPDPCVLRISTRRSIA